ncbi:MAG: hypothetical protein U0183_10670 [Polyangiaceae bacterium]
MHVPAGRADHVQPCGCLKRTYAKDGAQLLDRGLVDACAGRPTEHRRVKHRQVHGRFGEPALEAEAIKRPATYGPPTRCERHANTVQAMKLGEPLEPGEARDVDGA